MSVFLSKTVTLIGGTLYPAYRSFKAVSSKNIREYMKWMMYWIIYAIWLNVEVVTDIVLGFWMPFYYEAKVLFMLWLILPYTRGASMLYTKFVHPLLIRHEQDIDAYLAQAKQNGYTALLDIGTRGVSYVREMVAVAAFKGQLHLARQLRKSYSVNDLALSSDEDRPDGDNGVGRNVRVPYDEHGRIVEEEFQYLYAEEDAISDDQPAARRARRTGASKTTKISGYSTLPRRTRRRDGGI